MAVYQSFCNVLISVYPLPRQASGTLTLQSQLLSIKGCLKSHPAEEREPKKHIDDFGISLKNYISTC